MEAMRKLVLTTATMSGDQLEEARRTLMVMTVDPYARDLVLGLIDLFKTIGDDPEHRAQLAAACLLALEEGQRKEDASVAPQRLRISRRLYGCAFIPIVLSIVAVIWVLLSP
ncbi:MAG TPA: hypothetical protein PLU39_09895 [Armatimonadota bacterium]|nr:hypothetical protein [Armatimonadota bacterium]HPT98170.1 hypothetical protein [Armatimonadota bacterium]